MDITNDDLAIKLLKVAKSDVKASEVLYEKHLHPQSYFYFQQATEKAVKAFFLLTDISNPKTSFNIRHNLFKLHSKILFDAGLQNKQALDFLTIFQFLRRITAIKNLDIARNIKEINTGLQFFSTLEKFDLINIPSKDIKKFLNEINTYKIRHHCKKLPEDINQMIDKFFFDLISEIEEDDSEMAQYFAGSLREQLSNSELKELINNHFSEYINIIFESSYAYVVLYFCSFLTIQHSVLSRYPDSLKNQKTPIEIYSKKLPLVKYQPLFLDHLYNAIIAIEKLC